MRRLGAVFAALALTVLLVGTASASPRSYFYGNFDVLHDGAVVGHITATFTDTGNGAPSGVYSFRGTDGSYSTAQCAEASFYAGPPKNLWVKCLEIGFSGGQTPLYGIFVGHFVDATGGEPAGVEFWNRGILGTDPDLYTLSDPPAGYFPFDVGQGTFVLRVGG